MTPVSGAAATAAGADGKRKADRPISPPPVKRKAQSSISTEHAEGAVASFFTPASQKPREQTRTIWTERAPNDDTPATLLVGRYEPASDGGDDDATKKEDSERLSGVKRRKIAAFDLDSTLIATASGKRHSDDPADWKWWDASVPARLRQLYHEENYRVVILSNQAGLTLHPDPHAKTKGPKNLGKDRVAKFKQKCAAVLAQLDIPTAVYAATGRDIYRKPRPGMWAEVCDDYDLAPAEVDREASFFVGDAGGRTARLVDGGGGGEGAGDAKNKKTKTRNPAVAKDFSCSDRNFAHNVGVAYRTPEEYFLGEAPREFLRDFDLAAFPYPSATTAAADSDNNSSNKEGSKKELQEEGSTATNTNVLFERKNARDLVLFCGPPGSGKSTFFRRYLQPLGYERVNQDTLKTRAKCLRAASDLLSASASAGTSEQVGGGVVVDNTNPDKEGRREWVELARRHGVPVRCVWLRAPAAVCEHNDVVRALNKGMNPEARTALPKLAFNSFFARFQEPTVGEGFQDVVAVDFQFRGTKEEYEIWGRYWT
ncbi:DNA kinase/phosphatase Pnk1 [Diatrype stigma]|uniref:DNA kinase/phosphatase Pnk1 n=1 Tax=Diatrype stigma TaxID=117547 RepID=A0AAN9U4M9_9PEZI